MTKEEIKTKWLHELRNGGHEQVQGTLKGIKPDGNLRYCCLGVLEEKVLGNQIAAVKLMDSDYIDLSPEYVGLLSTYDRLKEDVIGDQELVYELIEKNDEGWTFAEIADYIERNWNTDIDETVE